MPRNQSTGGKHLRAARMEVRPNDVVWLASILEDTLSWRQLRALAKARQLHQYSYLGKQGLSLSLACASINKAKRILKANVVRSQ
jgi:hypothetical protein